MILLIDNYDSFSYNLYQYFGMLGTDVRAVRNDRISVGEIAALKPTHLVLSPGPGFPNDAGICLEAVKRFAGVIPILGVCLGHQTIGQAFGAEVVHAPRLMHGRTSKITVDTGCPIFKGLPKTFEAARYHSLVVGNDGLPKCLEVTATDDEGTIMGLRHREYPVYGIQFHPESFMTEHGLDILKNFIDITQ
ncbi:Anthranilate synthase component II [[Clostridium] cellulosi]|jgi:anthranilate synthase, component II (EC 4.1.3.27)|uniref:Anthranilate synthase component II n=1 Tax=[Clostridium] cellulosi TaxID=29343 RepID=A0A078KLM8_9FIRM|nr:MAG: aminodeoxychorismate/anthranilate synthase component II [[Clostridium] cellulosi]CDZ24646.1 Anthranilate synthase component II [[Clostridium] cellulosi]